MEQLFDLVLEDIKVGSIQVSHKLLILGNCRKLLFLTLAVSNDQNIWYVLMRLKSTLFLDRFTFLRGFLNRIDENHRLLFDLFLQFSISYFKVSWDWIFSSSRDIKFRSSQNGGISCSSLVLTSCSNEYFKFLIGAELVKNFLGECFPPRVFFS